MSVDYGPASVLWNIMQKIFVTMISLKFDTDIQNEVTTLILGKVLCAKSADNGLIKLNGFCWHNMNIIKKNKY